MFLCGFGGFPFFVPPGSTCHLKNPHPKSTWLCAPWAIVDSPPASTSRGVQTGKSPCLSMFNEKTHYKWPLFNSLLYVYQRVDLHICCCWLFAIPCSFFLKPWGSQVPRLGRGSSWERLRVITINLSGPNIQTSPNHSRKTGGIMWWFLCDIPYAIQLWVKSCKILGQPSGASLDRRRGCCLGGLQDAARAGAFKKPEESPSSLPRNLPSCTGG